ncbi:MULTISPECIES: hypothetical protein [unclassified Microcoleus]|uniref:hypothetical protein n=1 Tax=unclassified Microcoleus TaxID=2642155 RepID=UPI002FD0319C
MAGACCNSPAVRRRFEPVTAILKIVQDVDSQSLACMRPQGCDKLHRAIDRPLGKPSKRIERTA